MHENTLRYYYYYHYGIVIPIYQNKMSWNSNLHTMNAISHLK